MAGLVHIVDAGVPQENLRQLSLLACEDDRIICVGPMPDDLRWPLPCEVVPAPLGMLLLAGPALRRRAGTDARFHAWSIGAWRAAAAAARGWPVPLSLPCVPRAHVRAAVIKSASAGRMLVTVPTESARGRLIASGVPDRCAAVLPPVVPNAASPDARSRTRKALGLADDAIVLAAPGAITPDSGQLFAVWVHAMIRRFMPNARLVVSGRGPSRRRVVSFSIASGFGPEHCLPDGRCETMDILACADVALYLPFRDCGVSVPVAALAAGTPLVASDTPDLRELCRQGAAARLVKPQGPRYAATAVCDLLCDDDAARQQVSVGRQSAGRLTPAAVRATLQKIHADLSGDDRWDSSTS